MTIRNRLTSPRVVLWRLPSLVTGMCAAFISTAAAQEKPPEPGFGFGVALGGYGASEGGVTGMYATTLDTGDLSDRIGLEVIGSFARGSFIGEYNVTYVGVGVFGTYRYGLSDQIDLIGLLGGQYFNVHTEYRDLGVDTGGFFVTGGAAAEYELSSSSAIRAQLLSYGKLDLMYIIRH